MQKLSKLKKYPIERYLLVMAFFFISGISAQSADSFASNGQNIDSPIPTKKSFLLPSDTFNKKRVQWYIGSASAAAGMSFAGLYFAWYKDIPSAPFHFFDDMGTWNQIDKTGHFFGGYFETKLAHRIHKWAGVEDKKAIWWAGFAGFMLQSSIEVFDGFSEKWGASISDIGFNAAGSMLYVSQELAWKQQRIKVKYSFHGSNSADPILNQRAESLYGNSLAEKLLKDYNGINMWFSVTTADFFKNQRKAKWLAIAVGYGAGGMYGGFENKWTTKINGIDSTFDYSNVPRYRRILLAPDVDLERIPAKKPGWRTFLSVLNLIKFPSPAIEFNTKGEIIFYPIYSFGIQYPLYLKK
jgi:hypothetical protein